ncbi:MAG: tetratricopeptide repeat protein [Gemmatimonadota bacterium]|jgi:TolB-like protein/Flp pilus assembly protein TadD
MIDRIKELWRELRQRRVVGAAAAYAAVAFVALQLSEILFPAFGLEPSAIRLLLGALLAGFPVVLAFSWVYDVTRTGLKRTDAGGSGSGLAPIVMTVGVVASGAGLGLLGWWAIRGVGEGDSRPVSESSIAVLPFVDLSEGGDQAYLGDGLAEEILNVLAGVGDLHVAARTSAFAFRDASQDIRDVGRQLGVATVLEGSIRRDQRRVRITAQLIDAETGFHLWSNTYDREVRDLFQVQDEIAGSIVGALLGQLDITGRSTSRHVAPPEAQEAYWQGRAQWNRRDAAGIPGALRLFERALTLDPEYPEAYAGLADAYALLPLFVTGMDPDVATSHAEAAALKAIELDPTLAEPYASLGLVRALERDRAGALASFGQALELNPSCAPALHWRANVLADMGQLEAAVRDVEKAARLDPLSPAIASDMGRILLWSGQVDAAEAAFDAALQLDFRFPPALYGRALVALERNEPVPLQMAFAQWAAVSGLAPSLAGQLAEAMVEYRRTGVPGDVPLGLQSLEAGGAPVSAGTVAALHALVGSRDGAVRWLRRSVEDRSWVDQYLAVNPVYDGLRTDPGFLEVITEVSRPEGE